MSKRLYFKSIKEGRDSFYVEYQPPIANNHFATLNLIFPHVVSWERISDLLDEEVQHWMGRYPVPLIIWVLDNEDDIIRPLDRDGDCLVAWMSTAARLCTGAAA